MIRAEAKNNEMFLKSNMYLKIDRTSKCFKKIIATIFDKMFLLKM